MKLIPSLTQGEHASETRSYASIARSVSICLIFALMLLNAGGVGWAATASGAPYEIDAIIPSTGSGAFLGKSYPDSFRALETLVNSTGGIAGRPIKFVYVDTQTSPQLDLQLVNGLISKHVPFFIDGGPSTACNASIPVVEKAGPVDYCLSPVIHPKPGSFVYAASVTSVSQAKVTLRYFRERGLTRIAMISSTDSSGQDFERETLAAMQLPENKNAQLVSSEHFNTVDLSVAAQIARIKASNPQILLVWTTGTPFGTVLRGLKDDGIDMPTLAAASNMSFDEMNSYANVLPKELYFPSLVSLVPEVGGKGPVAAAQSAYASAFKAIGVRPDVGTGLTWDAALILVDALRHVGSDATATQISEYISHLRAWAGINGFYDFTSIPNRGIGDDALVVARWDPRKLGWFRVSKAAGYL